MLTEANDVIQKLSSLVTKSFAVFTFNKAVQETTLTDAKRPNHKADSPQAKKSAFQGHNDMPVNYEPFHPNFNAPPSNHLNGYPKDIPPHYIESHRFVSVSALAPGSCSMH